ncbi:MAG: tRNA pseudouridine(55) synthase TruB [Alphaproteobacteria bacterium]
MTSARAVAAVRRILDAAKAGHAGTLDPLATGVLPIALGEATKTASYVVDARKEYAFTVQWGEARDTDDGEGRIVATSEARPDEAQIRAVLGEFHGTIVQVPPAYSAIKIDGVRAYTRARREESFEMLARNVEIESLDLVSYPGRDHAQFRIRCGKGTYIRSLARDIAVRLGTYGHIQQLRRLAVGRFTVDTAISLESLELLGHSAAHNPHLIPLETALDDIPALAVSEDMAARLRKGQAVEMGGAADRFLLERLGEGAVLCARSDGRAVALVKASGHAIRPVRVLNL